MEGGRGCLMLWGCMFTGKDDFKLFLNKKVNCFWKVHVAFFQSPNKTSTTKPCSKSLTKHDHSSLSSGMCLSKFNEKFTSCWWFVKCKQMSWWEIFDPLKIQRKKPSQIMIVKLTNPLIVHLKYSPTKWNNSVWKCIFWMYLFLSFILQWWTAEPSAYETRSPIQGYDDFNGVCVCADDI